MGLIARRPKSRWLVSLLTAMVALWVSGATPPARATEAEPFYSGGAYFHPDLARTLDQASRATGGAAYTALRLIWQLWDRADPAQVEESLSAIGERLDPPQRAYAELLGAYARLRRGDTHEAQRRIAALGYVDSWSVLGPFDNTGKTGFTSSQGPEDELQQPLAWGRSYVGHDGRQVHWRVVPPAFPYGWVDGGALLRPRQPICAFFASHVEEPGLQVRRAISLWVGARGAFRLFWNGVDRLSDTAYRGHDFDRRAVRVWLEPGENRVVVKVCAEDVPPMLSLRLADPDGKPDRALRGRAEGAVGAPGVAGSSVAPPGQVFGPLQSFERETQGTRVSAARQEAFARYLVLTDGDDPALHQARDLARAAAAEPSVQRLLLVAELSEDRNERVRWLERARALLEAGGAKQSRRDLEDVLLAEAAWLEQSLRPHAALPLYEQVLGLDADDVRALTGKARLYDAAGLKHSARSLVGAALGRNPRGVALLNMSASGLLELGQAERAHAAESLYSALRFDDHGPMVDNADLARAQRREREANHWVERLLALSPDSTWARNIAARTQRSFAQPERARESYESALRLAPEDVDALRELADLNGELGQRGEQVAQLRRILGLEPQNAEVRQYVDALEPSVARADEAYAWKPERFLGRRFEPARGYHRRTLLDLTVTQIYENGLGAQFRQIVFQPLTEAGAAMARQYSFTFQADRQRAELRGARVYRAAGNVDEAIQSGEGPADNPALTMYTSARTVYVQFPRLEVGDVVELTYRIDDVGDRGEFAGYFGEVQYMQAEAPLGHAEYIVITPEKQRLYVDAQRVPGLEHHQIVRGGQRIHTFKATQVPGVSAEPAMPPWSEVLGFVHVSTYPSYREIGAWYWGLSRDQLELDGATRELTRRIAEGATTVREKVERVYDWVVQNTRYVALEFGIYGYKPRRSVQTVSRGWGDCKDKAAVIVAMLGELGVDATMVLVRSGMRGRFQSEVASLAPFDHAIAYVPELDLYLDGTAEYTGSRELPSMDQGALGLQVNAGTAKVVKLPENDPEAHVKRRRVQLRALPGGAAELELEYETSGPSAAAWRQRYASEATRRARVQEDLLREYPGIEIGAGALGVQTSDLSDWERPVTISVRGRAPNVLRAEGRSASVAVTPSERLTGRFAGLQKRRLDVDIGSFATIDETVVVSLAAAEHVIGAPVAARLESEFGSVLVEVTREPGKLTVHSRLSLKVSRVRPDEYAAFRRFCQSVDAAFEPRLVLGAQKS